MKPYVSVIIAALNEEEAIGNVVASVPPDIASEIIVVDNGSTDRTAERAREAKGVYGTQETAHPGVSTLYAKGEILLSGRLEVLELPAHENFQSYRLTPSQSRHIIFR